ncbi:hypothetical protein D3C85_1767290 [compost metagenome]
MQALPDRLAQALAQSGPFLLEIDMLAIGGFKTNFAGPPVNQRHAAPALIGAK